MTDTATTEYQHLPGEDGTEELLINMGPQHPSTHGVLRLVLTLDGEKSFNLILLREDIRLGLRLEGVAVDAWLDGQWKELAKAESIGSCHLWRLPETRSNKVRVRVTKSPVCPALSDFGLYLEPAFPAWQPPVGGGR